MRILEIRHAAIPLIGPGRNAMIDFSSMTSSVVAIVADSGGADGHIVGLGFGSIGRYEVDGLLGSRFIPRLLHADPDTLLDETGIIDPVRAWAMMMVDEKPGGHGERAVAVAALDMALWDVAAKASDEPLYATLNRRFGDRPADRRVPVYAAGGYYGARGDASSDDVTELQDELRRYLDLGFTMAKIKIGGAPIATDLRRVEAALAVLDDGERLAVDANGRCGTDDAVRYAAALEPFRLRWFEEPGDPLDFELLATVAQHYPHPLAGGENLFSMPDLRNLVRYAHLRPDRDVLQLDPSLSYGMAEYVRVLQMLSEHGWRRDRCVPHGGHQFTLHVAAGLGLGGSEAYPGVFSPIGGFSDDIGVVDGVVSVPDAAGIGLEGKRVLMDALQTVLELDSLGAVSTRRRH